MCCRPSQLVSTTLIYLCASRYPDSVTERVLANLQGYLKAGSNIVVATGQLPCSYTADVFQREGGLLVEVPSLFSHYYATTTARDRTPILQPKHSR